MSKNSVKQVMIDNRRIGIVGLEAAIEKAKTVCAKSSESEISSYLLGAVSDQNYIPSSAAAAYGKALLREYKIALNLPVDPETQNGLIILVLGMGCARCDQLQSDVRDVLSEMQISADIRRVTDIREISHFGILGAPALVINNKVVAVGEIPPKSLIRRWITDACGIYF